MNIFLIRHLQTPGNRAKRYIGSTDESLCEDSIPTREYKQVERVYVSPMKRCIQTAERLFPGQAQILVEGFRECDFGQFELKTYEELKEEPLYQQWINSGGTIPFPEGEDPIKFRKRCVAAFETIVESESEDATIAMVVHGGTIMSILEALDDANLGFYSYQAQNGLGYEVEVGKEAWKKGIHQVQVLNKLIE